MQVIAGCDIASTAEEGLDEVISSTVFRPF
jgi:hypothetical protein